MNIVKHPHPAALIERFTDTHGGYTPYQWLEQSRQFAKLERYYEGYSKIIVFFITTIFVLPFVIPAFILVPESYGDTVTLMMESVLGFVSGLIVGSFVVNNTTRKKAEHSKMEANRLYWKATEYLGNVERVTVFLSEGRDPETVQSMSLGQMEEAARLDLTALRSELKLAEADYVNLPENASEEEEQVAVTKRETTRDMIHRKFLNYQELNLVHGSVVKWLH